MLDQEIDQNSRSQSKLIKIEKSVEQMIEIITKLLEFERIETEVYTLKIRKIILDDILKTIISKNLIQANIKEQTIRFISPNEISLKGDSFILQQIFENLISNAIKFSPIGSNIVIMAEEKEESIVIEFQDEGPGLTDEDQKNLFKKFKKLSAKPTGNEFSSGLGLSIAKKYAEMHSGRVYARNNNTKGTTFYVELNHIRE